MHAGQLHLLHAFVRLRLDDIRHGQLLARADLARTAAAALGRRGQIVLIHNDAVFLHDFEHELALGIGRGRINAQLLAHGAQLLQLHGFQFLKCHDGFSFLKMCQSMKMKCVLNRICNEWENHPNLIKRCA